MGSHEARAYCQIEGNAAIAVNAPAKQIFMINGRFPAKPVRKNTAASLPFINHTGRIETNTRTSTPAADSNPLRQPSMLAIRFGWQQTGHPKLSKNEGGSRHILIRRVPTAAYLSHLVKMPKRVQLNWGTYRQRPLTAQNSPPPSYRQTGSQNTGAGVNLASSRGGGQ